MTDLQQLEALVIETLEQQAFLLGDPVSMDELPQSIRNGMSVSMAFQSDSSSGQMSLVCPEELALELAANVLGLDEAMQVERQDAEDALGELVNVVVGRSVTTLFQGDETVRIGAPQLAYDLSGDRWTAVRGSESSCPLLIEDYPTIVTLELT